MIKSNSKLENFDISLGDFFTVMFTLSKAREILEIEGYRVKSRVYADMRGR